MISFLCGHEGGVGSEGVVDTRVGNQVGLELVQVNIESSVKSKTRGDGGNDLSYQPVQVGVGRSFHREIIMAEVVDCLQFIMINYLIIR